MRPTENTTLYEDGIMSIIIPLEESKVVRLPIATRSQISDKAQRNLHIIKFPMIMEDFNLFYPTFFQPLLKDALDKFGSTIFKRKIQQFIHDTRIEDSKEIILIRFSNLTEICRSILGCYR